MKQVLKLSAAFLREHPARLVLTSLATVAAAGLVVWVVSGYDALLKTFGDFSPKALGRYTLSVSPINSFESYAPGDIPSTAVKHVPPEIVEQLRADPAVATVDIMWARSATVRPAPAQVFGRESPGAGLDEPPREERPLNEAEGMGRERPQGQRAGPPQARQGSPEGSSSPSSPSSRSGRGGPGGVRPRNVRVLGTTAPAPPFSLKEGRWIDPANADAREAAISVDVAEQLGVELGGSVLTGEDDAALRLRIVGIVDVPTVDHGYGGIAAGHVMSPSVGGLYVPMGLAERLHGVATRISFLGIVVKPDADITKFRFGWTPKLGSLSTPLRFQDTKDIEDALDRSATARNFKSQAYAATAIAMVAALFIICSTLSMGVSERIRQYAMLRAVALTRTQVVWLVLIESLVFATIGLLGGIGAGQAILTFATRSAPKLLHAASDFRSGSAAMGPNSILLAAVCAYGGTLLAAIIPAWRATRVKPIDAMAPRPLGRHQNTPLGAIVAGLLLVCIQPLITFVAPLDDSIRYGLYATVGFVSLVAGFVLVAPGIVIAINRVVSPLLARLFSLPTRMVRSEVAGSVWRIVGTSAALTVGLGLYVAILVWGYTMLDPFLPGDWSPAAAVSLGMKGLPPDEAEAIADLPGVDSERCVPLFLEQPRLLEDLTDSATRATVTRQDTVIMAGLDPMRAMGGNDPLLDFEWVAGSRERAVESLRNGRGCVVPDHFLRETGLRVGESFDLVPPKSPASPVRYTIAGAVRLPGWHFQTLGTGFRPHNHRAAALIFADAGVVARDFGIDRVFHVWCALKPGADTEALSSAVREVVSPGMPSPPAGGRGRRGGSGVTTVKDTRGRVESMAGRWIWASASQLPFVTLLVTCVGVLNSILASVRARRWDFGVLRAIGFTRWALVRLVIVEGLLVGIVAALLSVGFGIMVGWCGVGISQYTSFFAGFNPALVIPWRLLGIGILSVLALCVLAATWPAISIGKARPLSLLQQGRGAF